MLRLHVKMEHPQPRPIAQAVEVLRSGGLAIYPTDTTYGLGCDIYAKRTVDRLYQLKGVSKKERRFSFICSDLSEVARYAIVENRNYKLLRRHFPGKYTFILPSTREVPKVLQTTARTIGIRIPENPACLELVRSLGHPIIYSTVSRQSGGLTNYTNDPDEIMQYFQRSAEVFLDAGLLYGEPTTIVDLCGSEPKVIREGSGSLAWITGA